MSRLKHLESEYLFRKNKDLNTYSNKRIPVNIDQKKWIIFPLRPVEGLVCEHGYAMIVGQTVSTYKIRQVEAPKWKKITAHRKVLRSIKKENVSEYFSNKDEAQKKTLEINRLVLQYEESIKRNIVETNQLYFKLINEFLNV